MEKKKESIEEVKCIKTILSIVMQLILFFFWKIKEYPSIDYHYDEVLNRHRKCINSICELDDGTFYLKLQIGVTTGIYLLSFL